MRARRQRAARRDHLHRVGLRVLPRIAARWGLTTDEQRVLVGESPTLESLSYLVRLYESLERVFRYQPAAQVQWLRTARPESLGGHDTPLTCFARGEGARVCALLELLLLGG